MTASTDPATTTDTAATAVEATAAGGGHPDPAALVDLLRRTFDQSRAVIEAVSAAQVTRPTPCAAFDVETLVGHMLFAADRVGSAGRRQAIEEAAPGAPRVPLGDWAAAMARAADAAVSAWRAPGAFDGDIVLPFGTFPASFVAMMYVVEQATHAWDLAVAIGATERLDPALAETVLPLAHAIITPEIRGDEPMPFGPEVAVPADAPATDRLAGFMGRRPAWAA